MPFYRRRCRQKLIDPDTFHHGTHGLVLKDNQNGRISSQDSGILCEKKRTEQWLLDQRACRYCKDNTEHSDDSDTTEEGEQQYHHKHFERKI